MRYLFLAVIGAAACGGSRAAESAINPERGLRSLTQDSAAVSDIAIEAARSLPPQRTTEVLFAGVYVNDRLSRTATDAVKRATGFVITSGTGKPEVRCRVQSSTGSREVPCPAQVVQSIPSTISFASVRATADSAYVGMIGSDGTSEKASCLTLVRRGVRWVYVTNTVIANAKFCGR
jgi:hypothetical protein